MPKVTHSESAFQGVRGSSHSRKHGLPIGEQEAEGSRTTYQEGDITLPEGTQDVGLQSWVSAWFWVRQVQCREGHSGENSVSGKTGIHFKISAQKGVAGLFSSQEGGWVPDPYRVPPSPTLK